MMDADETYHGHHFAAYVYQVTMLPLTFPPIYNTLGVLSSIKFLLLSREHDHSLFVFSIPEKEIHILPCVAFICFLLLVSFIPSDLREEPYVIHIFSRFALCQISLLKTIIHRSLIWFSFRIDHQRRQCEI